MIFENSKIFQNFSKISHFFDFFGPPALKIAKLAPRTLGRAPKALSQMGSRQVEIFFRPRATPEIEILSFWTFLKIFKKNSRCLCQRGGLTRTCHMSEGGLTCTSVPMSEGGGLTCTSGRFFFQNLSPKKVKIENFGLSDIHIYIKSTALSKA